MDRQPASEDHADLGEQPVAGDALLRHTGNPSENHVALFVRWSDSAKTRPVVIEQAGSNDTVERTWSGYSGYTSVRYDKIEVDKPDIPGHSVTGDSYTDLVALRPDGTMWLYSNNFARDDGIPYGSNRQIGHGWNTFDRIIPADITGDGYTDLAALKPDGTMWLYSNNFVRDDGIPYGSSRQIGHGWNIFDRIVAADVTGDGFTDLVGLKSDGTMWLYSNNFVRDDGIPYGSSRQIGHGWNGFNRILA